MAKNILKAELVSFRPPPRPPYSDAIWQRRGAIGAFVATSLFVTYLACSAMTPIYEATAKIDVDRRLSKSTDAFMGAQMQLIHSDSVLRPVAEHYDLQRQENPSGARDKTGAPVHLRQLKVSRFAHTSLLEVRYRSPDPQLAADVANAIAQSYVEQTFNLHPKNTGPPSFMEKQLEELRTKMDGSSLALTQYEQELETGGRLQQRAAALPNQGELTKLEDRVDEAKQRLADVSSGKNDDERRKAANDLAQAQRQFDEASSNAVRQAESRQRRLQGAGDDDLNAGSAEYQRLKRMADADKTLYDDLERRMQDAGIETGFRNSSIRIVDPAKPPESPVLPRTNLSLVVAFLASTAAAIGAAALGHFLKHSTREPKGVVRVTASRII